MRLNAAEIKSKRKTRTKRKNTVNAVIHENDLQNGTEKEIKLWAWLGNPWILSGRNDRSSEGDSLIPKKKTSTEGGGHCMKGLSPDHNRIRCYGTLYIPASLCNRSINDMKCLPSKMWPLTFLTCLSQLRSMALPWKQPLHWPIRTDPGRTVQLMRYDNKALVR